MNGYGLRRLQGGVRSRGNVEMNNQGTREMTIQEMVDCGTYTDIDIVRILVGRLEGARRICSQSVPTAKVVTPFMTGRAIPESPIHYETPKYFRLTICAETDIEVYDRDMPVMTFLDMEKAVAALKGSWRIPTSPELKLIQQHHTKIGGFVTEASDSDFPDWYWSSTEHRDDPSVVWNVRLSDGNEDWIHKDYYRLSCRPIRNVT